MRLWRVRFTSWAALALVGCAAGSQSARLAHALIQAQSQARPIPVLSKQCPGLDMDAAYAVQRAFVCGRLGEDKIAGFKLGLTSSASRKRFRAKQPLAGVLWLSGKRTGSPTIDASKFHKLVVECEVAFVMGEPVTKPLADAAALRAKVRAVAPAIELPDLGFADMNALTAADIVAANVSARQFILGRGRKPEGLDLDAVRVTLWRDGEVVNRGRGADALGDQWQAALWLVNAMVAQGWRIEPGHVLITGALGRALPGKPGRYVADHGPLGKIAFAIE